MGRSDPYAPAEARRRRATLSRSPSSGGLCQRRSGGFTDCADVPAVVRGIGDRTAFEDSRPCNEDIRTGGSDQRRGLSRYTTINLDMNWPVANHLA